MSQKKMSPGMLTYLNNEIERLQKQEHMSSTGKSYKKLIEKIIEVFFMESGIERFSLFSKAVSDSSELIAEIAVITVMVVALLGWGYWSFTTWMENTLVSRGTAIWVAWAVAVLIIPFAIITIWLLYTAIKPVPPIIGIKNASEQEIKNITALRDMLAKDPDLENTLNIIMNSRLKLQQQQQNRFGIFINILTMVGGWLLGKIV